MYDKWSLEVLYSGFEDEKFLADFAAVDGKIAAYQAFADALGSEGERETVKKALLMDEEFEELVGNLFSFCSLRQSVDTSDTESVSYMGRLMQKMGDVTKATTLIEKYIEKIADIDMQAEVYAQNILQQLKQ